MSAVTIAKTPAARAAASARDRRAARRHGRFARTRAGQQSQVAGEDPRGEADDVRPGVRLVAELTEPACEPVGGLGVLAVEPALAEDLLHQPDDLLPGPAPQGHRPQGGDRQQRDPVHRAGVGDHGPAPGAQGQVGQPHREVPPRGQQQAAGRGDELAVVRRRLGQGVRHDADVPPHPRVPGREGGPRVVGEPPAERGRGAGRQHQPEDDVREVARRRGAVQGTAGTSRPASRFPSRSTSRRRRSDPAAEARGPPRCSSAAARS